MGKVYKQGTSWQDGYRKSGKPPCDLYETLWNPVKQWGKLPVNYLTYLSTGVADFSQPSTVSPSGSLVQKCPEIHFEEVDLHHQTQTRCMGWSQHHLRGSIPEDTEFGELVQCWLLGVPWKQNSHQHQVCMLVTFFIGHVRFRKKKAHAGSSNWEWWRFIIDSTNI